MDVRCPRCSTEYELDETRVPDEGATVKCASCSFVFLVRKQVEEATGAAKREWKVRQANGNVFVCHELTTLQRWIVEGKVGRDDEISLSGETWKRLGNIPELASFFQVAEDAARGRAYEAMQTLVQPPVPAPVAPPTKPPTASPVVRTSPQFTLPRPPPPPAPSVPPPPEPTEAAAPVPPVPVPPSEPASADAQRIRETWKEPAFQAPLNDKDETLPHHTLNSTSTDSPDPRPDLRQINIPAFKLNGPAGAKAEPAPLLTKFDDEVDDDAMMRSVGNQGSSRFAILLVLGLLLGAGVGYYFLFYAPEHEKVAEVVDAGSPAIAEVPDAGQPVPVNTVPTPSVEAVDAGEPAAPAVDAGTPPPAPVVDSGAPPAVVDAGKPVVDAGAPAAVAVDAGVRPAAPAVPMTYDAIMRQADRLRDAEKAEAALSMYGRAADLEPNRIEPMAGRGLALLDMGQANAALAAFEQVLARAPKYGPAVMGTAEAWRMLKNNAKAVEFYQKYLDELPEGSEAEVARNNIKRLKP